MKKSFLFVLIGVLLVFSLAACGEPASNDEVSQNGDVQQSQSVNPEEAEPQEPEVKLETAEDYANALKDAGCPIGEIVVYTEETDPNEVLGRPNQYTSKVDFSDTTLEQPTEGDMAGGTIEVFATAEDCTSRYEYLKGFDDPELGAFGLNQYMYKGDTVILRVSYDVTPTNAETYEKAFNELIGQ